MTWTLSRSLDEFHTHAGAFLAAHPAENTVLLTVANRLTVSGLDAFGGPPLFGWWRGSPAGPVEAAVLQTPPYEPRLSVMPAAAAVELAVELAGFAATEAGAVGASEAAGVAGVTGISGGAEAVRAFAAAWAAATGAGHAVRVEQRLYRLGELTDPPRPPAGRGRPASPADRELVIRWYEEFGVEAEIEMPNIPRAVDDRIAAGVLHLWEDGGRPVSLAGNSPVVAGMSRIGPVYTPAELRGHGYATAVTATASAAALTQGATEVLLYTDLANPTSNSIYQQIGYLPVEDCLIVDFQS